MVFDNAAYVPDEPSDNGRKRSIQLGTLENGRVPEVSISKLVHNVASKKPSYNIF